MPRVAYSRERMAEAVALGQVIGADAAAAQLGMGAKAIRVWSAKAGKGPEMVLEPDAWKRLLDLAIAKVTSAVASGKMRPRDMAVVAGIATRNLARASEPVAPPSEVETVADALIAAMETDYPGTNPSLPLVLLVHASYLSGDEVMDDPIAVLNELLATHGSFEAAREWMHAEDHRRMVAQLARNRQIARDWLLKPLDPAARAILAAGEAFLEETA